MSRLRLLVLTLVVVSATISSRDIDAYAANQAQRCFPETGKCISGAIRSYWEKNGGLPIFGFPISDESTETNGDGWTGPTQWFERDRLETHGREGVMAGRLAVELLDMTSMPWQDFPTGSRGTPGCRFFEETAHTLCPPYRQYWEQNGGIERFGLPISEPIAYGELGVWNGEAQFFERRRVELHPENAPPYNILLGLLGNEVYERVKQRTPQACNVTGATINAQPSQVTIGGQLVLTGRGWPRYTPLQVQVWHDFADEGWVLPGVTSESDGTFRVSYNDIGYNPISERYVQPGRFTIAIPCDDGDYASFPIEFLIQQ